MEMLLEIFTFVLTNILEGFLMYALCVNCVHIYINTDIYDYPIQFFQGSIKEE